MILSLMKFSFRENGHLKFQGKLKSDRCEAETKTHHRCKKNVVIGLPYCWIHLKNKKHLRIKESEHGKGLFVDDPHQPHDVVVFHKNDKIIDYVGEHIDRHELDRRYGKHTAPYALEYKRGHYIDSALERGAGSMANHASAAHRNARLTSKPSGAVIKADRNIKNDKEVLVGYGRQYRFNEPTSHLTK